MSSAGERIPDEVHVLAGEYVLGALDAAEMSAVRRQADALPMLARAIEAWERRLAPMTRVVAPLPPPPDLWDRLEQAIGPAPETAPEPAWRPALVETPRTAFTVMPARHADPAEWPEDTAATPPPPKPKPEMLAPPEAEPAVPEHLVPEVASVEPVGFAPPLPEPAPAEAQPEPPARARPIPPRDEASPPDTRHELSLRELPQRPPPFRPPPAPPRQRPVWPWQIATAGAFAFAAGIAAVVLVPGLAPRHAPIAVAAKGGPQVAAMMPPDGHASGFLVEARPDGTVVLSALASVDVPAGKALELWILPPGGTAPKSLGVLPPAGGHVALPAMPGAGTDLMLSLEPPGGSPTGAPTGPVLFEGKLRQLSS